MADTESVTLFPNTTEVTVTAAKTSKGENTIRGNIYTDTYGNGDSEYHSDQGFGVHSSWTAGNDQKMVGMDSFTSVTRHHSVAVGGDYEQRSIGDYVVIVGPSDIEAEVDNIYNELEGGYLALLQSPQDDREEQYLKARGKKKLSDGTIVDDPENPVDYSKFPVLSLDNTNKNWDKVNADLRKRPEPEPSKSWGLSDILELFQNILSNPASLVADFIEFLTDEITTAVKGINGGKIATNIPWMGEKNPYYLNRKKYNAMPIPPSYEMMLASAPSIDTSAFTAVIGEITEKPGDYKKILVKHGNDMSGSFKNALSQSVLCSSYPPPKSHEDPAKDKILKDYWEHTEKGDLVDGHQYGYAGPDYANKKEKEDKLKNMQENLDANLESLNRSRGYINKESEK